jgi:hypothetical protein
MFNVANSFEIDSGHDDPPKNKECGRADAWRATGGSIESATPEHDRADA